MFLYSLVTLLEEVFLVLLEYWQHFLNDRSRYVVFYSWWNLSLDTVKRVTYCIIWRFRGLTVFTE